MSRAKVVQTHIPYGKPQELTNVMTHAICAALGFVGLVFLLIKSVGESEACIVSAAVFGGMLVAVFVVSVVRHSLRDGKARDVFARFEHCAAPALMLGAYAPVMLCGFGAGTHTDAVWGYTLFAVLAALTAAIITLNGINAEKFKAVCLVGYVLGIIVCVMRVDLIFSLCGEQFFWMIFGGAVAYLAGMIFYSVKFSFGHVLWHVCAAAGAAIHFAAIYIYLL